MAIKILPAAFASNAQLQIRFEREAKAISQISHPHICALHDVGRADGVEAHRGRAPPSTRAARAS